MDSKNYIKHTRPKVSPFCNIKFAIFINKYVGCWPPVGQYRRIYGLFSFLCLLLFLVINTTSGFIQIFMMWGDSEKMIGALFMLITNIIHMVKAINVYCRQERIQLLLNKVNGQSFLADYEKYERIISHFTWTGIFHYFIFKFMAILTISASALLPVLNYFKGSGEKTLPQEGWYPYNFTISPAYEMTAIQQIVSNYACASHNCAIDAIAMGFMSVACCQIEIMKCRIKEIDNDLEETCNKVCERGDAMKTKDRLYRELVNCIEHHVVIFKFAEDIMRIFGLTILLQFMGSCCVICITAVHITQLKDYGSSDFASSISYLSCMIYQPFIYCWFGNELILQSESVVLAAYSGNWYHREERFKRALRLVILRANRPIILTAGSLMELSLETFTAILKGSYSFFTVLQSTTSSEELN